MQNPSRKDAGLMDGLYYPFGRSKSHNLLEDYNPPPDHGLAEASAILPLEHAAATNSKKHNKRTPRKKKKSPDNQPSRPTKLNILLLRCTDLHSSLVTICTLPSSSENKNLSLAFYANNACLSNVARNILIMKIMLSHNFKCTDKHDLWYLWDVWFNVGWRNETKISFLEDIKELLENSTTMLPNVTIAPHITSSLQKIWKDWKDSVNGSLSNADFRIEFHKSRKNRLNQQLGFASSQTAEDVNQGWGFVPSQHLDQNYVVLPDEEERAKNLLAANMSIGSFPSDDQKQFTQDFYKDWIENDHSKLKNKFNEECLNPTLLEPGSEGWTAHPFVNPLADFLPIYFNELRLLADDPKNKLRYLQKINVHHLMVMHCQKKLSDLVKGFLLRKDRVEFFFYQEDPLELCFQAEIPPCVVVDSSDLADELGMANVLLSAKRKLFPHPASIISTEVFRWVYVGNMERYIEQVLFVPKTMFPTVYGLKLATPVQLGELVAVDFLSSELAQSTRSLTWRWTPASENVVMEWSSCLENYLKTMKSTGKFFTGLDCSSLSPYTPQTFIFILSEMFQGAMGKMKDSSNPSWTLFDAVQPPPQFHLAWKTLKDWQQGRQVPIRQLRVSREVNPIREARFVRLLLSSKLVGDDPCTKSTFKDDYQLFDNVDLNFVDGNVSHVSFRLTEDLGLYADKIQHGYLIDAYSGRLYYSLLSLNLDDSAPSAPYPYSMDFIPSPYAEEPGCFEYVDHYCLFDPPGFETKEVEFSTGVRLPCQSTHQLTLRAEGVEDFTVKLPHSFLRKVFYPDNERVAIIKKSIFEPQLESFDWSRKLNLDGLGHCEILYDTILNMDLGYGNLFFHLERQFSTDSVELKDIPLNGLRRLFSSIFHVSWSKLVELKKDVYIEIYDDKPEKSDIRKKKLNWILRIHSPVLMSPSGSPMLVVTAFDNEMAMKANKVLPNESEIFKDAEERDHKFCIRLPEIADLFRFTLRYNSTRVSPNVWQRQNVPSAADEELLLVTFISPLYASRPRSAVYISNLKATMTCSHTQCNKKSPSLRCTRCRNALYCTQVCQKSHWKQHKPLCHNVFE